MKVVEIKALKNGGHRNHNHELRTVPNGWAVVPDSLETKNFPFGELVAEEINGVMTVTSWTPGVIPETDDEATVE